MALREKSGSLNRVKVKKTDRSPDYKGTAMIEGKKYFVSGWIRESSEGRWLSLAYDEAEETANTDSSPVESLSLSKMDDKPF